MKMQKLIIMFLCVALLAGTASAVSWIVPEGDPNNLWDIPTSWSTGVVPVAGEKTQFGSNTPLAECIIDIDAYCGQLVIGDGGSSDFTRKLTIVDGGSLTCAAANSWAASGYNRPSNVTVEEGGTLNSIERFGIGLVAAGSVPVTSYLNINGGDMTVANELQIGQAGNGTDRMDHTGIVNVFAGTLDVDEIEFRDTASPSIGHIDISFGTLTVNGDITTDVATWEGTGNIIAFGGAGTLVYDYNVTNPGKTTITAIDPMNGSPAMCENVVAGDVVLSWTNKDPMNGAAPVVDVFFGTDPTDPNFFIKKASAVTDLSTLVVNAPDTATYYWQVKLVGSSNPDPNSPIYHFHATNDLPPYDVKAGFDMITWIDQPVQLGSAVQLGGTYEDDAASPVVVTWSSNDPNVVFVPGGATSNAVNPTVSVDYVTEVTLTFSVKDALNPAVTDDVVIEVWNDACEAARLGAGIAYDGDFNNDCIVNIVDLAEEIAAKWLLSFELKEPKVIE